MSFSNKVVKDFGTLKQYGDETFKVTHIKNYLNPEYDRERRFTDKGGAGNEEKLSNNLSRTKAAIFELASCNPWELFVTFTFDKEKIERDNLELLNQRLSHWIRNYNRKYGISLKFMLLPERHSDGINWHMHGFVYGLPLEHLTEFEDNGNLPKRISDKLKQGEVVYNWLSYLKKFGYCVLEVIKNFEAASKYITKYITKDLQRSVKELNSHMYYASKGLKRAELVCKGVMSKSIDEPKYENDYVSVSYCDSLDEAFQYFDFVKDEFYDTIREKIQEGELCFSPST